MYTAFVSRGRVHSRRATEARGSGPRARQLAGVRPNLPRVSLRQRQSHLSMLERVRLPEDCSYILVFQSIRHARVEGGLRRIPAVIVGLL